MTQLYDSGLASPQRKLIADKIVELLTPLKKPTLGGSAAGFLDAIIPIGFRVERIHDDFSIDLLWKELNGRAPAIAVAPLALKGKQTGGPGRSIGDLEVALYIVSTHLRGRTEGRASGDAVAAANDTKDPGIWAVLELCWARLFDAELKIPTLHELKLELEDEVMVDVDKTIWRQVWSVVVGRDANMYRGLSQKFTSAKTTLDPTDDQPIPLNMKVETKVEGMAGVARDDISKIYAPASASQWTTTRAVAGILTGNPTHLWLGQEAVGNLLDSIGAVPLVPSNAPTYQRAVAGWARKAVRFVDGAAGQQFASADVALPNIGASSALLLGYCKVNAPPAATRVLQALGGATLATAGFTSTPRVRGVSGANSALGTLDPTGAVRPFALRVNRTAATCAIFTDQEKVAPAFDAAMVGKGVAFGGFGATSADSDLLYAVLFEGVDAELTDAQVKKLLETLGWTIAWS